MPDNQPTWNARIPSYVGYVGSSVMLNESRGFVFARGATDCFIHGLDGLVFERRFGALVHAKPQNGAPSSQVRAPRDVPGVSMTCKKRGHDPKVRGHGPIF